MLLSEKKLNQIIDSYYNGQFKQLKEQLKKVSVKQLIAACELWEVSDEIKDRLLKYKVGA